MNLDHNLIPIDWTPEQALAMADFLLELHDAIWHAYGYVMRDLFPNAPDPREPVQLRLPLDYAQHLPF